MKGNSLVTLTHREYQALLRQQRFIPVAELTGAEKQALARARREMAAGNFVTLKQLKNELGGSRRRQRSQKS